MKTHSEHFAAMALSIVNERTFGIIAIDHPARQRLLGKHTTTGEIVCDVSFLTQDVMGSDGCVCEAAGHTYVALASSEQVRAYEERHRLEYQSVHFAPDWPMNQAGIDLIKQLKLEINHPELVVSGTYVYASNIPVKIISVEQGYDKEKLYELLCRRPEFQGKEHERYFHSYDRTSRAITLVDHVSSNKRIMGDMIFEVAYIMLYGKPAHVRLVRERGSARVPYEL